MLFSLIIAIGMGACGTLAKTTILPPQLPANQHQNDNRNNAHDNYQVTNPNFDPNLDIHLDHQTDSHDEDYLITNPHFDSNLNVNLEERSHADPEDVFLVDEESLVPRQDFYTYTSRDKGGRCHVTKTHYVTKTYHHTIITRPGPHPLATSGKSGNTPTTMYYAGSSGFSTATVTGYHAVYTAASSKAT